MPLKPAASARCTKLAASSRSLGVYSWKNPGVSPKAAPMSSIGSTDNVEATIGTPVRAAARAVARSPWPSWAQMPMTPIGAMKRGDGRVIPNRSTDRSRSAAPTNMRGMRPHRSKTSQLARWVRSSPAPPATYDQTEGGSAVAALASNCAKAIGRDGTTPARPCR